MLFAMPLGIFYLQVCNQLKGNWPIAEVEIKMYLVLDCMNMGL